MLYKFITITKIQELSDLHIIEPAQGSNLWIDLVAVVPKLTEDIQLCIGGCRENEAMQTSQAFNLNIKTIQD